MSIFPLYLYFIAISFVASLSVYFTSKKSYSYLKLFPPFLLATIIAEAMGSYLLSVNVNNLSLYNFFTVFEFVFYLWIINLIISNKRMKKIIRAVLLVYTLTAVVNIILIQKMKAFHTVTYALGCLLIVIFCFYYFLELFKFPKAVKLTNNPAFWISTALLFFYCCGFPLYGLINYLSSIPKLIINNFYSIIIILNCFLYTLFTIAFLCRIKIRNYTLSSS